MCLQIINFQLLAFVQLEVLVCLFREIKGRGTSLTWGIFILLDSFHVSVMTLLFPGSCALTIWLYVGAFEPCESNITPRKNCHFFQEMGLFGFEALIFLAIISKRFHFLMWFAGYFDQICGIQKISLFDAEKPPALLLSIQRKRRKALHNWPCTSLIARKSSDE